MTALLFSIFPRSFIVNSLRVKNYRKVNYKKFWAREQN